MRFLVPLKPSIFCVLRSSGDGDPVFVAVPVRGNPSPNTLHREPAPPRPIGTSRVMGRSHMIRLAGRPGPEAFSSGLSQFWTPRKPQVAIRKLRSWCCPMTGHLVDCVTRNEAGVKTVCRDVLSQSGRRRAGDTSASHRGGEQKRSAVIPAFRSRQPLHAGPAAPDAACPRCSSFVGGSFTSLIARSKTPDRPDSRAGSSAGIPSIAHPGALVPFSGNTRQRGTTCPRRPHAMRWLWSCWVPAWRSGRCF
jgi:hypothetical protein